MRRVLASEAMTGVGEAGREAEGEAEDGSGVGAGAESEDSRDDFWIRLRWERRSEEAGLCLRENLERARGLASEGPRGQERRT